MQRPPNQWLGGTDSSAGPQAISWAPSLEGNMVTLG